jgi:hypothetical protein
MVCIEVIVERNEELNIYKRKWFKMKQQKLKFNWKSNKSEIKNKNNISTDMIYDKVFI